ncbi:hypothetical protein CFT12S05168_08890, partial [Campylobacter fetus subsp. testudinum]
MSIKKKNYDDEELKAKRVFTKVEIASKSTYNYNQKNKAYLKNTNSNIVKTNKKNTQVVIKIT